MSGDATGRANETTVGLALLALVAPMFCMVLVALAALAGSSLGAGGAAARSGERDGVSALARRKIPALYLRLYQQAAMRYGIDWAILAGVGKVECDHGRDTDPSCTREGIVNASGAGGPMQFLASTWSVYGVDGNGDGSASRWDPADAIYAAASFLEASGAPRDDRRALFAYNHAAWYVDEVERFAASYRGPPSVQVYSAESETPEGADWSLAGQTPTPVRFVPGQRARLAPDDGHLALIPAGVPRTVQAMVVAGNELQSLPYGPRGHPDPRGATQEDCSSTVNYVLYRAGVRAIAEIVTANPLAQDYVRWGEPGPGRWVTIYATDSPTPHVFTVIAGLRLDTSHDGTDVGPNRAEDGPRWRILDYLPTWAHWSVRHPPGL